MAERASRKSLLRAQRLRLRLNLPQQAGEFDVGPRIRRPNMILDKLRTSGRRRHVRSNLGDDLHFIPIHLQQRQGCDCVGGGFCQLDTRRDVTCRKTAARSFPIQSGKHFDTLIDDCKDGDPAALRRLCFAVSCLSVITASNMPSRPHSDPRPQNLTPGSSRRMLNESADVAVRPKNDAQKGYQGSGGQGGWQPRNQALHVVDPGTTSRWFP